MTAQLLVEIEGPCRAEGKLYKLPHVLLFSILAVMAGANSHHRHRGLPVMAEGVEQVPGVRIFETMIQNPERG